MSTTDDLLAAVETAQFDLNSDIAALADHLREEGSGPTEVVDWLRRNETRALRTGSPEADIWRAVGDALERAIDAGQHQLPVLDVTLRSLT